MLTNHLAETIRRSEALVALPLQAWALVALPLRAWALHRAEALVALPLRAWALHLAEALVALPLQAWALHRSEALVPLLCRPEVLPLAVRSLRELLLFTLDQVPAPPLVR